MIYFAVLGLAMVTGAMAIGALLQARGQDRVARIGQDASTARELSVAGISYAMGVMNTDRAWRSKKGATWFSNVSIGGGRVTLTATTSAGGTSTMELDPVIVTSTAQFGAITRATRVTILPTTVAAGGLGASIACGGTMTITGATVSGSTVPIYSAGNISATGATMNVPVQSARTASGGLYLSGSTSNVSARTIPESGVVAYYTQIGTPIPRASLPQLLGTIVANRFLLSPNSNPFGTALNPRGVYVVDLAGANLTISNCRVVGTLVLRNAGTVTISRAPLFEPAEASRPVLIVQGNVVINTSAATLNESGVLLEADVNFNPEGTPFPFTGGSMDADMIDTYVHGINGLVYAEGNIAVRGTARVRQIIAARNVSLEGTLTLNPDPTLATTPPPGFYWVNHAPQSDTYAPLP